MQSPIGLVPKANNKTRQIFHLSYDFGESEEQKSFNYHIPDDLCTVVYNDLDHALKNCTHSYFRNSEQLYFAKADMMAAFRQLQGKPDHFRWLIMKTQDPKTGKVYYFIDKCVPFGASHSCFLYQEFSNSLKYTVDKL